MTEAWQLDTRLVGRRVEVHDCIPSTSDRAWELAADPASDGLAVLAHEQTAGRGTQGRRWQCPPGAGVLLSVILFPPPELRRAVILTALGAVAVCETIRTTANLQARIKWPNDVLFGGKKVCGILTESKIVGGRFATVCGIGINVNQPLEAFTGPGLDQGTSLSIAAGRAFDTPRIARQLLHHLDDEYQRLLTGDLATLESVWKWRIGLLGRDVVAECSDGDRHGRLLELGWDGVELEAADGVIRLRPEVVKHLRAPH